MICSHFVAFSLNFKDFGSILLAMEGNFGCGGAELTLLVDIVEQIEVDCLFGNLDHHYPEVLLEDKMQASAGYVSKVRQNHRWTFSGAIVTNHASGSDIACCLGTVASTVRVSRPPLPRETGPRSDTKETTMGLCNDGDDAQSAMIEHLGLLSRPHVPLIVKWGLDLSEYPANNHCP